MANQVFANGMEVSCKAADGKSICAFPDVCFTPPQTPATPPGVPIPYPNTGLASDTSDGSTTVKISGQEVMLKNKSYFKKSTGDEAGCAPMKGVVTHKITGKVYFTAWSMDVKVEGENVVRMMDLTTHNHGSVPGNTSVWPYIDESYVGLDTWSRCADDIKKEHAACSDCSPRNPGGPDPCAGLKKPPTVQGSTKKIVTPIANQLADDVALNKCLSARRCALVPDKANKCCDAQTPHHIVEASSFIQNRGKSDEVLFDTFKSSEPYSAANAPCVCAEGTSHSLGGTHELMHTHQSAIACQIPATSDLPLAGGGQATGIRKTTYKDARDAGVDAFQKVFMDSGCDPDCIRAQLDAYHNQVGISDKTECQAVATRSSVGDGMIAEAEEQAINRFYQVVASRL